MEGEAPSTTTLVPPQLGLRLHLLCEAQWVIGEGCRSSLFSMLQILTMDDYYVGVLNKSVNTVKSQSNFATQFASPLVADTKSYFWRNGCPFCEIM